MEESEEHLNSLGVNVLLQSSLEQKIETDAASLINQQLIEQEHNRLERAQNALTKTLKKRALLQRKLNNASRISVKQKLREQLKELNDTEVKSVKSDINDIQGRLDYINKGSKNSNKVLREGMNDGESEREFLIRTGKITAFGSKSSFQLDTDNEEMEVEIEDTIRIKQKHDYDLANEQMVENLTDDSGDDYIPEYEEEVEEDINDTEYTDTQGIDSGSLKNAPGATKDDGDETYYRQRLRRWIAQRSKDRKVDDHPELPEWRKRHPNIADAKLNDEFKIPGDIFSLLFNYQKTCVQWLYELNQQNCGGIIGDEMGLGKTIQVITLLASLHHSGLLNGPVLIVCPATVMKQWCNELHHWWPPLRAIILHSMGSGMVGNRKITEAELEDLIMNSNPNEFSYDEFSDSSKIKSQLELSRRLQDLIDKVVNYGHILITTYVGLRVYSDKLLKVNWSYAILDEGHKIRNPDSDISLTCKKLRTQNRIILSGTPIQNNLNELWSLFDFIFPGKLGTLPVFQRQFVLPINMGGYANATNMQVQTGYKCAVALRDMVSPYLLRRVKADVAKDLPVKKEMVLFCKLTQFQRSRYLEFLSSKELDQIQKGKRQVLYGIDILRKICNHPDLLEREAKRDEKSYGNPKRSGKMQIVKQLLILWKNQGHKTLLFTQSRQMLDILEEFVLFKDKELTGIKYLRMDGNTKISIRQSLVDRFNNEHFDVFLLTTRVGGLGVNLTGANRIIIFDPDWNPSTDMQARERAWRIGQKREVSIYRLMVTGTIEEKIYHRQIFKQFLTNKILSDPKQKRFFKMNELHDLFTLGGENGHATEELENEVNKYTQKLKQSRTEESDDFEQVINFSGVSKLEGYYNGKEAVESSRSEDDRLMEGLLGKGTIEAAKLHDSVIDSHSSSSPKSTERDAARAAERALEALKESRKITKKYELGTPTWTGKFGQAGKIVKKKNNIVKGFSNKPSGSAQILANIRTSQEVASCLSAEKVTEKRITKDERLLIKIKEYLNEKPDNFASSSDIVENAGVKINEREDIIKVRALLRTIATFEKDKKGWALKYEFRD